MKLKDIFNKQGDLTFDPYRVTHNDPMFAMLFDKSGYLKMGLEDELVQLVKDKGWSPWCNAVGVVHVEQFALATKGSYPTIYYWR